MADQFTPDTTFTCTFDAIVIFETSNGELTTEYYKRLAAVGAIGMVAMNVFRAQKCSIRAKGYRKRQWANNAYERKQYSLEQLDTILRKHAEELGIRWGWKKDPNVKFGGDEYEEGNDSWVLYVDLPTGQVSYHTPVQLRDIRPYAGEWDGMKGASTGRIMAFCDTVYLSKYSELSKQAHKPLL